MNNRISGLDLLRYISLLAVIATHFFDVLNNLGYAVVRPYWLERMAGLAIAYFLLSSAFLITTLFLEEHERKGSFSIRKFFYRRGLRLLPAYFVLILLVYFVVYQSSYFFLNNHPAEYYFSIHASIFNFLFLTPHVNEFFHPSAPYLFHTTTMGLEYQFYLIAGILFFLFRKKYLATWLIAFMLLAAFIILHNIAPAFLKENGLGFVNSAGIYFVYTQLHIFAMGVFAAFIYFRMKKKEHPASYRLLSLLVFIGFFLSYLFYGGSEWNAIGKGAVIFSLLMFIILNQRLLASLPFQRTTLLLGNISYGAYLFHYIIMVMVMKTMAAFMNLAHTANMAFTLILVFIACTLGGIFSYYIIEKPFLKVKKRYTVIPTGG